MLNIPRPTINMFLHVPVEISLQLMASDNRDSRGYTKDTHDQHEKNSEHLKRSIETYDMLCKLFPKDFKEIQCAPNGKMLSIAEINDKIWKEIKPILPPKPPHAGRDVVVKFDEAKDKPEDEVINTKPEIKPAETTVEKPKQSENNDILHITVKNVSLLAARKVRAAPDIKSEITALQWSDEGEYEFYTPANLTKKIASDYKDSLQKLANNHKQLLREAKSAKNPAISKAMQATMPFSALVTIKISADIQGILSLITQLKVSDFSEVKWLAEQIQVAASRLRPNDFTETEKTLNDILGTEPDLLSKIAAKSLIKSTYELSQTLSLQEIWPKNEFSLLVDALYSYSTSSRTDILSLLESWSYDQKREALNAAISSKKSTVLDEARYRWDLVATDKNFRNLRRNLDIGELQAQPNTVHYGYDLPEEIEQASLEDAFVEAFEESSKLFNLLSENQPSQLAEYAVLAGHKNRWQFITTAKDLQKAKNNSTSATNNILLSMLEKVAEHHTLIADFIENPSTPAEPEIEEKPIVKKPQLLKKPTLRRRHRSRKPKK
jgi:cell division septum initiation protein DivIVA